MTNTHNLRQTACTLSAAACLCLLSGCLHLEQTLQFQPDGSVVATYHSAIPAAMLPALTAAQNTLDQQLPAAADGNIPPPLPMNWFLNETAVRNFFRRPGVELRQYRQVEHDGQHHVHIIILATDGARAVNTGLFGTMTMKKQDDGRTVFTVEPPGHNQAWTKDQVERLRQLCPDLKLTLTVTAPADIVDTNGAQSAARTVTWTFADDGTANSPFAIIPTLKATW